MEPGNENVFGAPFIINHEFSFDRDNYELRINKANCTKKTTEYRHLV